jgi:SAM-dependent methyltransferase
MRNAEYWNREYGTKGDQNVSWFEAIPGLSLEMITASPGFTSDSCVVDIGGGTSRLVDALVENGLTCLAVLDVSSVALDVAKSRLGLASEVVEWIASDVAGAWSLKPMDIWHDRAVFHFLTAPNDRAAYVAHLQETLKVGGSAVIATFAPDGPEKCSGLPVARYSPEALEAALGPSFRLADARPYQHVTPSGAIQPFQYSRLTRVN